MKNQNKKSLYLIVFVLAIASIAFRLLNKNYFEQTSLLFIGVPTLITLLIVRYSKKPKSAYGIAFLTITIFLLISGIFLGEGFVCILFMAPIFYAVTAVLVWIYQFLKKKGEEKTYSFVLIPVLFLMFQPSEFIKEPELHSVKTVRIIDSNQSLNAFNKQPDFLSSLPNFFKIGFPKPIEVKGKGIEIGATRTISFKSSTKGVGRLVLEVKEKTQNKIVFKIKSDDTHIDHWLTYKEITVEIIEENTIKKLVWTTSFICDLGPSWYFEPSEKFAIDLMNQHLINSYFKTN